eukprot:gnl/MRDRNA2_/MRDRNA2_156834_c0_seq1.p1 gnl/MRDRNA2_/MRDRNA2_156834_c0~~gnl/MRDRNA2_/MRDRNA2_156834_c0_seq1.p1  ORF type:complete len:282 (+),score=63.49 gnl/MRDRNA2_/MRDRNA2_156834_c0_seq1:70-915(+)
MRSAVIIAFVAQAHIRELAANPSSDANDRNVSIDKLTDKSAVNLRSELVGRAFSEWPFSHTQLDRITLQKPGHLMAPSRTSVRYLPKTRSCPLPFGCCKPPSALQQRQIHSAAMRTRTNQVVVRFMELTEENVEKCLEEVRPYLMADGGNVELVEIDGLTVKLKLVGACGSCASSAMTMKMGIEKKLKETIPDIVEIEEISDDADKMELTEANVETVLEEIRPYLIGTGGGELSLEGIDGPVVRIQLTGPASQVMTVRVAITQKLRDNIPTIAAVQLSDKR